MWPALSSGGYRTLLRPPQPPSHRSVRPRSPFYVHLIELSRQELASLYHVTSKTHQVFKLSGSLTHLSCFHWRDRSRSPGWWGRSRPRWHPKGTSTMWCCRWSRCCSRLVGSCCLRRIQSFQARTSAFLGPPTPTAPSTVAIKWSSTAKECRFGTIGQAMKERRRHPPVGLLGCGRKFETSAWSPQCTARRPLCPRLREVRHYQLSEEAKQTLHMARREVSTSTSSKRRSKTCQRNPTGQHIGRGAEQCPRPTLRHSKDPHSLVKSGFACPYRG